MTRDVMVDLETLGSVPGCAILSIGAVSFGKGGPCRDETFEAVVSRSSCAAVGLHEDADTLDWWGKQSPEARAIIDAAGDPMQSADIKTALVEFSFWLAKFGSDVRLWGNGSDFDNAILSAAYRAIGMKPYWKFWNNRCYRTLKSLRPDIKMERSGTHHCALDDAISQAEHAARILAA